MKMLQITAAVVAAIILLTAGMASHVKGTNEGSPYSIGFTACKQDAKTNLYDSTNACNYNNYTAAQTYACLKGYADGDTSRYQAGYLQGIQGTQRGSERGSIRYDRYCHVFDYGSRCSYYSIWSCYCRCSIWSYCLQRCCMNCLQLY
jgi:hypothetical protein